MKKKLLSVLMASVLVFGMSTTVLAAGSPIVNNTEVSTEQIEQATEVVDSIIANAANPVDAKQTIITAVEKEVVIAAMQKDVDFQATITELEENYTTHQQVTVEAPAVDAAVADVVKADSIEVVGAGLNGTYQSTVKLNVAPVAAPVEVASTYANAVQVDIKLLVNDAPKANLEIPVAITMEVPTGVSTSNLVILHFHDAAGNYSVIRPQVNGSKITFAVDGFSTFVFANEENTAPTAKEWTDYQNALNALLGGKGVVSPKTGDVTGFAAVVALMSVAVAGVVIVRRKSTVK